MVANQQVPAAEGTLNADAAGILLNEIDKRRKYHTLGRRMWTLAYHVAVYGAAVLSAAAAVILVPDSWATWAKDPAVVLAAVAALLSTVSGLGGFERKWRANANTVVELELLKLDAELGVIDAKAGRDRLEKIMRTHAADLAGNKAAAQ